MGRTSPKGAPLATAVKYLNAEICKTLLQGEKPYFTRHELIDLFVKYKGECMVCGLSLSTKANLQESAYFTLKIHPKVGGKVSRSNLILVCRDHLKEFNNPKALPLDKCFGFDTFSDLIVQLVAAKIENNPEKIKYFQICVENAMTEYINTMRYHSIAKPKELTNTFNIDKSISSCVIDITERLIEKLKETNITKTYIKLKNH